MLDSLKASFLQKGWVAFRPDFEIAAWSDAARPLADEAMANKALCERWMRSGGTWFVGVNSLPNDASGAIPERGVPPLAGGPVAFATESLGLGPFEWDQAQLSVCLPGYPQPDPRESEAAYRFRVRRDAAHVDGLIRDGKGRRHIEETHGFILGIPLAAAGPTEAPFVIYEGSHEIMRRAFADRLAGVDPRRWHEEDITDTYVAARRQAFEECRRVEIHVRPGEAYMAHRLALHGVAPWQEPEGGSAPGARRAIAYFRPDPFPGRSPEWWLEQP